MLCVDASDFDLAGCEFEKFAEVAVAEWWDEAVGCEVDWEVSFAKNSGECEIIRDGATPAFADFQSFKCCPPNCSWAAPAEVFRGITTERRRDRCIPNITKLRSDAAFEWNKPAIAARSAKRLVREGRN